MLIMKKMNIQLAPPHKHLYYLPITKQYDLQVLRHEPPGNNNDRNNNEHWL